jgi:hypothetical protein
VPRRNQFRPFISVQTEISRQVTRRCRKSHGLRGAAPPQPKISPRNTRMNANRKEVLLDYAKLLECDSPRRVALGRNGRCRKRCEHAPHSQSTACETLPRSVSISVIRVKGIFLTRDDFALLRCGLRGSAFQQRKTPKAFARHGGQADAEQRRIAQLSQIGERSPRRPLFGCQPKRTCSGNVGGNLFRPLGT